jgi:hypothetical protein
LDNFDDRYLGAKSSDPSLDNDGNALAIGALYFNTTDGVMKVYTASGWIAASSASVATLATFEFVATAGQTVFTGNDANGSSLSYVAPAIIVTLNGVRLRPGDDYTATNGTSITLISAAALNDELVVDAFGSFLVANTYTIAEVDAFAVKLTGNQSIAGNKNFAGNTLYVDDTNDRVGVGTASPSAKLHVYGGSNNQFKVESSGAEANFTLAGTSYAQINNSVGDLYITNDTAANLIFRTASTERMRIDSSGYVTRPYQPAFGATGQNGSASGIADLVFPTAVSNTGGHYSTSTGRFTAPVAGRYYFSCSIDGSSSGLPGAELKLNGTKIPGASSWQPTGDGCAVVVLVVNMSAGDYVNISTQVGMEGGLSQFCGFLIG